MQLKSSEGKFSHLPNLVIFEATEASSPSCRRFLRWLSRSVRRAGSASSIAFLLIPILVSTVFPVSSVHCQETVGGQVANEDQVSEGQATDNAPLVFLINGQPLTNSPATLGPVKEGHATVQWSRHPDASGYRLVNEQGVTVYEGRFNRAFVSGLNNGSHSFRIVALDEAQRPIVTGREPLTILVDHWDRRLTLGLFSLGAVVLLCVGLVLGVGAMRANTASDSANSANSNEEAGR